MERQIPQIIQANSTGMLLRAGKTLESNSLTEKTTNVTVTAAMMDATEADMLVKRITTEVLAGIGLYLDNKIDPILKSLESFGSRITEVNTRVDATESRISDVEDANATTLARLAETEARLSAALEKLDDQENRGRRCNIRVIGLAEGCEGTDSVAFFKTWLPELLDIDTKHGYIKIERAHRAFGRRPEPGQRARAVVIKLHNYQDKARIMQAARSKGNRLCYNDKRISIFEDFSVAVIRKRQEYASVKQQLRDKGITFAMMYPAILRVDHNGRSRYFKSPREVVAFLGSLPSPSLSQDNQPTGPAGDSSV